MVRVFQKSLICPPPGAAYRKAQGGLELVVTAAALDR